MLMEEYGLKILVTWRKLNNHDHEVLMTPKEMLLNLPLVFHSDVFSIHFDIIKHGDSKLSGTLGVTDSKPYADYVNSIIKETLEREGYKHEAK